MQGLLGKSTNKRRSVPQSALGNEDEVENRSQQPFQATQRRERWLPNADGLKLS